MSTAPRSVFMLDGVLQPILNSANAARSNEPAEKLRTRQQPMTTEKIIDRVKKLLRLADSSNIHEAAVAAGQAQKLMERHRIDQSMVSLSDDGEQLENGNDDWIHSDHKPLESCRRLARWKSQLANTLVVANDCRAYIRRGGGTELCLIGRTSDVTTVTYMYAYLKREIERLRTLHGAGKGAVWANSFRRGAVHTIRKRLQQARTEARKQARNEAKALDADLDVAPETAVARIDEAIHRVNTRGAEVDQWMDENMRIRKAKKIYVSSDWSGYSQGCRAGMDIDLCNSESTRKRLKEGSA
jgi:hypothetical protein